MDRASPHPPSGSISACRVPFVPEYTPAYAAILCDALAAMDCLLLDLYRGADALTVETHLREHLILRQQKRKASGA